MLPKPTESELAILLVLWAQGPVSVRTVHEQLHAEQEKGYTTTLKLMQIMTEKGLVRRDTSNRTHIYEAVVQESDVQSNLLSRFVEKTFRGSTANLVMQALGREEASDEELNKIRELLDRIEKERNPKK